MIEQTVGHHQRMPYLKIHSAKRQNGILKVKDMRLGTYLIALMLVMCLFSCGHQQSNIYSPSLLVLEDSLETMPENP